MSIRRFITTYLKDRDMTLMELTEKLGYRSKTSVVRAMNGDISIRSLEKFADRFHKLGGLSEQEKAWLEEAVELMRWQDDYYPVREMLDFLQGKVRETGNVTMDYINPDPEATYPKTFADSLSTAKDIEILLMNAQYTPIFEKIRQLLVNNNAKVSHYLMVNEDTSRTIHAMNAIFPIVFLNGYSGYLLRQNCEEGHNGIQFSDFMLVNWTDENGVRCESLVLFVTAGQGRVYRSSHPGTLAKLLEIPKTGYMPIKRSYTDTPGCECYTDFCLQCAEIERNRRVFGIKPDPCFECIPVDILLSAAREGAMGKTETFVNSEDMLCQIFSKRYKNTFESRKAHHVIMKRSSVWKFARTGCLLDHFWGMRPFTLQERARILRNLIDQMENNPYFHVYFLKDNSFLRDMEIFCYDGKGLLIVNVNSDYDLAGGHTEVMLDHPEFQRLYKDFYLKHLIREHVITSAETIVFLRSLVEYCEDPNTKENALEEPATEDR